MIYQKNILTEKEFTNKLLNSSMNAKERIELIIDGIRSGCKGAFEFMAKLSAELDDEEAEVFWAQEGARIGSSYCMNVCGEKCLSPSIRVYWLKKAYQSGSKVAAYRLAECYMNGIGVPQKPLKAAALYREASDAGVDNAKLGYTYLENMAVDLDVQNAFKEMDVVAEIEKSDENSRLFLEEGDDLSEVIDLSFAKYIMSVFAQKEGVIASDIQSKFDMEEKLPDEKDMYLDEQKKATEEMGQAAVRKHGQFRMTGIIALIAAALCYFVLPNIAGEFLSEKVGNVPFLIFIVLIGLIAVGLFVVSSTFPSEMTNYILPVKIRDRIEKQVHKQYLKLVDAEKERVNKAKEAASAYEIQMQKEIDALKAEVQTIIDDINASASIIKHTGDVERNVYMEVGFFMPQTDETAWIAELRKVMKETEEENLFKPLAIPVGCNASTPFDDCVESVCNLNDYTEYAAVLESALFMFVAQKPQYLENLDILANRTSIEDIIRIRDVLFNEKMDVNLWSSYKAATDAYIESAVQKNCLLAIKVQFEEAMKDSKYDICKKHLETIISHPAYFAKQLYMIAERKNFPIDKATREEYAKLAGENGIKEAKKLYHLMVLARVQEEYAAHQAKMEELRRKEEERFEREEFRRKHQEEMAERARVRAEKRFNSINDDVDMMERLSLGGYTAEELYDRGLMSATALSRHERTRKEILDTFM